MPKLTISVASEDEINELTKPITKIDYDWRVISVPTTHNATPLKQWSISERDLDDLSGPVYKRAIVPGISKRYEELYDLINEDEHLSVMSEGDKKKLAESALTIFNSPHYFESMDKLISDISAIRRGFKFN